VGVTIRPQTFGMGVDLPRGCSYGGSEWVADKFVKLNTPYSYRLYVCATDNTWQPRVMAWAAQQSIDEDQQILDILRERISYAKNRWGATLFHIDSSAYAGWGPFSHTIMRTLAAEFADCLLIPEIVHDYYSGSTAPYRQANMDMLGTVPQQRAIYPNAFSVVNIADADFQKNGSTLIEKVRSGDILVFRAWFGSPEIGPMQAIYSAAQGTQ